MREVIYITDHSGGQAHFLSWCWSLYSADGLAES